MFCFWSFQADTSRPHFLPPLSELHSIPPGWLEEESGRGRRAHGQRSQEPDSSASFPPQGGARHGAAPALRGSPFLPRPRRRDSPGGGLSRCVLPSRGAFSRSPSSSSSSSSSKPASSSSSPSQSPPTSFPGCRAGGAARRGREASSRATSSSARFEVRLEAPGASGARHPRTRQSRGKSSQQLLRAYAEWLDEAVYSPHFHKTTRANPPGGLQQSATRNRVLPRV